MNPCSAVFPFWLALVDESLQPFFSVARHQVLDHECRSIPVLCRAFSLSRTGASAAIFAVGTFIRRIPELDPAEPLCGPCREGAVACGDKRTRIDSATVVRTDFS